REDLDLLLRAHRAERLAVEKGAAATRRRPLLARAEVVDVAEDDVVHRLALRDRERHGEVRQAALRIQRAVDRVEHHAQRPAAAAAASTAVVSSPPSPWPTTGSRSARVGSSARTPRTSSTAPRQTESQSVLVKGGDADAAAPSVQRFGRRARDQEA